MNSVPMITAASLASPRLRHGFFTRNGGVSEGIYASLNVGLGSRDNQQSVAANRARVTAALGVPAEALATVYQQHTANVVVVDGPWDSRRAQTVADALVTNQPGLALGILTADCAPVLFADLEAGVIGAAHAGWRGAVGGVLANTLAAMQELGAIAERVVAVVGPCIAQCSYEVGPEFPSPFLAEDAGHQTFFTASSRSGHFLFDLPGYVQQALRRLNLRDVAWVGRDTCAEDQHFFSFRRSTLRGEPDYGREISAIALVD